MIHISHAEIIAGIVYLLILMSVGVVFKSLSRDINDYLRAGCKGAWWLIGANVFMASFSAMTFTAIAGQSFVAGWSVILITLTGAAMYLLHALYFAPLFRQMRITSAGDVLYNRFGRVAEQFSAYYGVLGSVLNGAVMLLGTATFISTLFGFPLAALIVVIGVVVTVYATFGGAWGIMAADFIQASVLVPIAIAVTVLCLIQLGGVGGLFAQIDAQGLTADFALLKSADHVYRTPVSLTPGLFTTSWLFGLLLLQFVFNISMNARYISVKDGREARKAALFVAFMLCMGAAIWYIPPMAARLLYYDQVMGIKVVPNVADASYAVVCGNLLPRGLLGVIAMAILSATMSSMDGTFNGTSALVIRNVYPPLMRVLGRTPTEDPRRLLRMGRAVNFCFGAILVGAGLYFARYGLKEGLYSYLLTIMAVVGFPYSVPLLLAMFSRRTPDWSYFSSFGCGLAAALFCFFLPAIQTSTCDWHGMWSWIAAAAVGLVVLGLVRRRWTVRVTAAAASTAALLALFALCDFCQGTSTVLLWQHQLFIIFPCGVLGWLVTIPFWASAAPEQRRRTADFYAAMHRPVDFRREVGTGNDFRQFKLVGIYVIVTGSLMLLLLLVPNPPSGRWLIGLIAGCILLLGIVMWRLGVQSFRRQQQAAGKEEASRE